MRQRESAADRVRPETRCHVLVENAHDVIFSVDQGGALTFFNTRIETLTGRPIADLTGTHVTDLVAPDQREAVWRQCQRALNGEDLGPFEFDVAGPSGSRRSLEAAFRPVFDGTVIVAVDAIARDVTSRNALEAVTRHEQKMNAVARLAAGVAHDFNNLLGVILGHCEATAPLVTRQPDLHPAVESIRAAAERAASLTGHLLVLSQRHVVQPRSLDLNQVVADSQPLLDRLVGEGVTIAVDLAEDLGPVRADAGQLRQVVANLAINAHAAMPNGGTITIATTNVDVDGDGTASITRRPVAPGQYVQLSVADTGVGIDPATLEWIFEPFFTTKAAERGAGLGLATVYAIVQQSGGTIDVDSQRGVGTTFRLLFPRVVPPVAPLPPSGRAAGGSETVLLVEDEQDLRDILAQVLVAKGYHVIPAASAAECLSACRPLADSPGLLVTDVVMPGMGGRELAETLAVDYPAMKVLFISGYTDDAVLVEAVRKGAHFLQKPFGLRDFATRVRGILDGAQAPA
jgi:PAS domain S-box-containing protein